MNQVTVYCAVAENFRPQRFATHDLSSLIMRYISVILAWDLFEVNIT